MENCVNYYHKSITFPNEKIEESLIFHYYDIYLMFINYNY